MAKFSVFFVQLETSQVDAANSKGWSATETTNAYADIITDSPNKNLNRASELGLYELAARVRVEDLDQVWETVQNHEHSWTSDYRAHAITKHPRSMMVGDIVLDHETKTFHFCSMIGWKQLVLAENATLAVDLTHQVLEWYQDNTY